MPIIEKLGEFLFERFTPSEVKERFERNELVLVDVRTPQEYALEHILGAMLFPLSSFDPQKLPQQDSKPIVFYCRSGKRSRTVAAKCSQIGIDKIAHMDGGFNAWKEADYPHVAIDMATGGYVRKYEAAKPAHLTSPAAERSKSGLNNRIQRRKPGSGLSIPRTPGELESLNSSLL